MGNKQVDPHTDPIISLQLSFVTTKSFYLWPYPHLPFSQHSIHFMYIYVHSVFLLFQTSISLLRPWSLMWNFVKCCLKWKSTLFTAWGQSWNLPLKAARLWMNKYWHFIVGLSDTSHARYEMLIRNFLRCCVEGHPLSFV
jgi:hypothetical protein